MLPNSFFQEVYLPREESHYSLGFLCVAKSKAKQKSSGSRSREASFIAERQPDLAEGFLSLCPAPSPLHLTSQLGGEGGDPRPRSNQQCSRGQDGE